MASVGIGCAFNTDVVVVVEEEEELVEEFDLVEIPGPDQEEGLLVLLEETRDENLTVQPAGPRDETAGKDTC